MPHPMVYETARVAQQFFLMDEILVDEKAMFAR
jgi:hypothetical protein